MTSSSSCEHLIRALELNCSSASYINSVSVLLRILDNIINEPHINKYRTIRLENQIIKEKLLPLHGIRELLSGIGFIEVNAVFLFFLSNSCLWFVEIIAIWGTLL